MGTYERDFQAALIRELYERFPGCVVMKMDASYKQGIPDILVLYNDRWAMLECKKSARAHHQPNQDYYVQRLDELSFCRFIYPENKEEVLYELESALAANRSARVPGCE